MTEDKKVASTCRLDFFIGNFDFGGKKCNAVTLGSSACFGYYTNG